MLSKLQQCCRRLQYRSAHHFSNTSTPLSTCIVGSGPSGFYAAKYLLKKIPNIQISIVDQLPTPFGLVRFGVAPDHSDTKNVTNDFTDNVLSDSRVSYFGNVSLNKNISISELQSIYDTVILSYGASSDKKLGIPGEDLNGIYSSRIFVNWYNGHPYFVDSINDNDFTDNKSGNIIIIGQGNVAIDCARILASDLNKLASTTDIATHAVNKLIKYENNIKNIYIIGRRGSVQASFTNKELREIITDMNDICCATINKQDMIISSQTDASQNEINNQRAIKRKMSIFERALFDDDDVVVNNFDKKTVNFRFLLSPREFIGDDNGRVKSVVFEKNELYGNENEQKAKGLGEFIEIESGLVLTSIGYKAECIDEISQYWNSDQNTVNHNNGRINDHGLYCTGWLKRGPSGIIGTNIPDAQQTVNSIIEDYELNKFNNNINSNESYLKLNQLLMDKHIEFVDKNGWYKIDEFEKNMGAQSGKPREKLCDITQMIEIAKK